jgi:endonuclease/exonuclease/phosphatase family metal-dependent hydrolase
VLCHPHRRGHSDIDADVIAPRKRLARVLVRLATPKARRPARWAGSGPHVTCGTAFGNVVLSRLPILHHAHDLSWKTCEPRCCQRADIAIGADTLHLYNVHLGTAFLERRYQAGRLSAYVHDRRVDVPKIVLGDFNEWMRGLATQLLSERLESIDLRGHLRRRRTYPGVFPVLHLDHIYYEGK